MFFFSSRFCGYLVKDWNFADYVFELVNVDAENELLTMKMVAFSLMDQMHGE